MVKNDEKCDEKLNHLAVIGSTVVFPSSAWKNCVFVLINSILQNVYAFESCFRTLAVILVSDFLKITVQDNQVTDVSEQHALVTHGNSDDGFHDLIVYHHRCGSSLRVGQGVGQNSTNDLALVHHLSTNSRSVSQQVCPSAGLSVSRLVS